MVALRPGQSQRQELMVSVVVLTATTLVPMRIFELDDTLGERRLHVEVVQAKVDVPLEGVVHTLVVGSFEILPTIKTR